ncbi:hypothetical protein GCM10029992_18010 [Glycomyces albus]
MKTIEILDSTMSYEDENGGEDTAVLLHGNPTSSHLWRNVVPRLAGTSRVVAPDLIGMGASGKPDIAYSFADHADYLEAFLEAVGVDRPVLVGYDWGGSSPWTGPQGIRAAPAAWW